MKGREVKGLLRKIKFDKGINFSEVADMAKINRSLLSSYMNSRSDDDIPDGMLFNLSKAFPGYFNAPEAVKDVSVVADQGEGYGDSSGEALLLRQKIEDHKKIIEAYKEVLALLTKK